MRLVPWVVLSSSNRCRPGKLKKMIYSWKIMFEADRFQVCVGENN
jgi:hypothetical protein